MREFPRKTTRAQILCSSEQGVSDLAGVSLLPEDVLSACHYRGRREAGRRGVRERGRIAAVAAAVA